MKKIIYLLLTLSMSFVSSAQKDSLRGAAIMEVADVMFTAKSGEMKRVLRSFEDEHSIKLNFRVDEASLDKIGGLSEYLFKIFQNFSTPVNTQMRSITGEFDALQNNSLTDILSYKTYVTQDLASCILPDKDTKNLDTLYNRYLQKGESSASDYSEAPENIDGLLKDSRYQYGKIISKNYGCPGFGMTREEYTQHVINTRAYRASGWNKIVTDIGLSLYSSHYEFIKPNNQPFLHFNGDPKTIDVNVRLTGGPVARQFINRNNSLDICTEDDLESRARLLYAKTNIRFFFITEDINFYLPADSEEVFATEICKKLFDEHADKNLIVALWLKMSDPLSQTEVGKLVLTQNGNWLSKADISFAQYNNSGSYKARSLFTFNNLFRNIPKPMVICYQVAKLNGMLTTSYFVKGDAVRGNQQIYYHSFRIDRGLPEIKQVDEKLRDAYLSEGRKDNLLSPYINELRNRRKVLMAKAQLKPEFIEAENHFKEIYLQDHHLAEAAALQFLSKEYNGIYGGNQIEEIIDQANLPDDIIVGSCKGAAKSDVIGDALNLASLLLMPTGYDCVVDALSVLYFGITDQQSEMFQSAASLLMPGSLSGAKKAVSGSSEIIKTINEGGRLAASGTEVVAYQTEHALLASVYGLSPAQVEGNFLSKINGNPNTTRALLPLDAAQSKIYEKVDLLPAQKKAEFLEKCYDDAAFRTKCLNDPEEVLRWGKVVETLRGVTKEQFLKSVPDFEKNPQLAERAWDFFKQEDWKSLEELVNAHNINGGWPPNDGFVDIGEFEFDVNFVFDRYGSSKTGNTINDNGKFVADAGTPFESRALPSNYKSKELVRYKVLKAFKVKKGKAIPWFQQSGKGTQYMLPESINDLINEGYIQIL